MCKSCGNLALKHNHSLVINKDVTKSKVLRANYSKDLRKRLTAIKGVIRKGLITHDVLHLKKYARNDNNLDDVKTPQKWEYQDEAEKIAVFMLWLNQLQDKGVLEVIKREGNQVTLSSGWQDKYIRSAYIKGVNHADNELRKNNIIIPEKEEIDEILEKPIHKSTLALFFSRNFRELAGILNEMDKQISRVLEDELKKGTTNQKVVTRVNDRVDKIGITRSEILSESEITRTHAEATLNRFEEYGVKGVFAKIETQEDERVCEICEELSGVYFTIEEARNLIPVHPRCRCSWGIIEL